MGDFMLADVAKIQLFSSKTAEKNVVRRHSGPLADLLIWYLPQLSMTEDETRSGRTAIPFSNIRNKCLGRKAGRQISNMESAERGLDRVSRVLYTYLGRMDED